MTDPPPANAVGDALLRAADETRDALAIEDPITAIHRTHRALKGARALLILIEGERRVAARRLRHDLSAAARSLASTRDRHIIHDALADLPAEKRHKPLEAALARKVAASLSRRADGAGDADANAGLATLRQACLPTAVARAAQLTIDLDDGDVPAAVAAGYRRARRAARGIRRDDAEALHEVRKHVVAHVCQMELAAPW